MAFHGVVTGRDTLLTIQPGVMPDGPYGYTGPRPAPHVYDPAPSAIKYVPWTRLASDEWKAGRLPFWNPFNGGGVPLWANGENFAAAPLRLPLLLHPASWMWDFWMLGRLFLAGVLTFLLAARLGLALPAALAAATAYMLGGYLVLSLNLMQLDVDVLLPGLLLAVDRLLRRTSASAFLMAALVAWAMALGGSPQAFAVAGLMTAGWIGYRAPGRRPALLAGLALAAGVAGALPHLVPFAEFLRRSHHLHHPAGGRGGLAAMPWSALPALLGPWAAGRDAHGLPPWYWTGAAVLLLAVLGAVTGRRPGPARFFLLVAGFELWKIFGGPGHALVGSLPVLGLIWWTKYAAPLALAMALLTGFGLQGMSRSRPRLAWGLVALVAGELILSAARPLPARHDPLAPAPYLGWLRDRLDAEPGFRVAGLGSVLMPDVSAAFRIPDIRLEDSLIDRDQYALLFGGLSAPKDPKLSMFITIESLDHGKVEVLRSLGVRWFIAAPGWRPREAVRETLTKAYDAELTVWRIAGARPFAGFPERGRTALALGLWSGGVLGLGLLLAGVRLSQHR